MRQLLQKEMKLFEADKIEKIIANLNAEFFTQVGHLPLLEEEDYCNLNIPLAMKLIIKAKLKEFGIAKQC